MKISPSEKILLEIAKLGNRRGDGSETTIVMIFLRKAGELGESQGETSAGQGGRRVQRHRAASGRSWSTGTHRFVDARWQVGWPW